MSDKETLRMQLKGRLIKTASYLAFAAVSTFSLYAVASRSHETEVFYYDELGNNVGSITYPCEGRPVRWGITTEYYTIEEIRCYTPPPGTPPGIPFPCVEPTCYGHNNSPGAPASPVKNSQLQIISQADRQSAS